MVIHWELCKKFKFDHTNKWYMHNLESILENETHKILWDFEIQTDHLISAIQQDLVIVNKKKRKKKKRKKRTRQIVDYVALPDHRMKLKESEKWNKYLDLSRELKNLWNITVTVKPIVVRTLGTVPKGLIKRLEDLEIRGWVETIQITALLRSARILRGVLETWGD